MKTHPRIAGARSALFNDLLRAGEALLPLDDAEINADRLEITRRGWQRIRSGEDPVPLGTVKLWCLETGLRYEEWRERFAALRQQERADHAARSANQGEPHAQRRID